MPILPTNLGSDQVSSWLQEHLSERQQIPACCDKTSKVPEAKGIYFWFMHPEAYRLLSRFTAINAITPVHTRLINGISYHLVYIGTAGTGKKGNSDLKERLRWHLCQKHDQSAICHGTLSTFRTGIGSLLSDDLEGLAAERGLNEFLCKHFFVYWLTYSEGKRAISKDEDGLIKAFRPIFNLKGNPNARAIAPANSTQLYKQRRQEVLRNARIRLDCKGEDVAVMQNSPKPTKHALHFEGQVYQADGDCVEYFVIAGQDIAEVTRGIPDLHTGKVRIEIFNSKKPSQKFDLWQFRATGKDGKDQSQNIYTYFSNTCPDKAYTISGERYRNGAISWWMRKHKVDEITVKVCKI